MSCPLCDGRNEEILWRDDSCRIIRVGDPSYPAFCRVIWNAHVKEMTDLDAEERARFLRVVFTVEGAVRELMRPEKINLASLGNQVPHLHWHVIPRFPDDAHFPDPIWSSAKRAGAARTVELAELKKRLAERLRA